MAVAAFLPLLLKRAMDRLLAAYLTASVIMVALGVWDDRAALGPGMTEVVEPGRIEEYVVRLYPFANTFNPGHRLVVELSNGEPLADEHNSLLPPDAFHLPVGRPVTHKIYRDAHHQSRLVLPFTVG